MEGVLLSLVSGAPGQRNTAPRQVFVSVIPPEPTLDVSGNPARRFRNRLKYEKKVAAMELTRHKFDSYADWCRHRYETEISVSFSDIRISDIV